MTSTTASTSSVSSASSTNVDNSSQADRSEHTVNQVANQTIQDEQRIRAESASERLADILAKKQIADSHQMQQQSFATSLRIARAVSMVHNFGDGKKRIRVKSKTKDEE